MCFGTLINYKDLYFENLSKSSDIYYKKNHKGRHFFLIIIVEIEFQRIFKIKITKFRKMGIKIIFKKKDKTWILNIERIEYCNDVLKFPLL